MRELGMVLFGCFVFTLFFANFVYPDLEYTGHGGSHMNGKSSHMCIDDCYSEYVKTHGTVVEIIERKKAIAALDEFSSIKPLWAGCAACHGQEGQGMSVFPKLAGQSADYISNRLNSYKNRETVGAMSSTMWSQAGMLSDSDIKTLSKFIEVEL